MEFTDMPKGPFERRERVKPPMPDISEGNQETDPQAPPGFENELALDIHGKAETIIAEEGGSQVLGDTTAENETTICSETAIIMDFLDLPEIDEEDHSLKRVDDENITSAPKNKDE